MNTPETRIHFAKSIRKFAITQCGIEKKKKGCNFLFTRILKDVTCKKCNNEL